jgi:hypothetical protein
MGIGFGLEMTLLLSLFVIPFLVPLALATALHFSRDRIVDWRNADRWSAGLLPPALPQTAAVVRIFSARTVRWRGIVSTHSWIVLKDAGAARYSRFDYTAWGEPIWVDRFIPDGRWFGRVPELVFAADGAKAERMIPLIHEAIRRYAYPNIGDYRAWPGPNSNTFVARSSPRFQECLRPFRPPLSERIFRLIAVGLGSRPRVTASVSISAVISVSPSAGSRGSKSIC